MTGPPTQDQLPSYQPGDSTTTTRFQIPNAEHPEELYEAQIYAIQLIHPYLVSGSADKTIRIWDVGTQRLVREPLRGHDRSIICLRSSLEQDIIVSGSADASVIIWRFSTGEIIKRIEDAHADTILSLRLDENFLITGGRDGKIKVWEIHRDYAPLATLEKHSSPLNAIALHSASWTIVSGAGDGTVRVWRLNDGECVHETNVHSSGIACLDLDPTGRYIVTGHSSLGTITFYDLQEKKGVAKIEQYHQGIVRTVKILSSGARGIERIVTGGYDGSIRFFGLQVGEWIEEGKFGYGTPRETVDGDYDERVFDVAYDLERGRVYCAGQKRYIVAWQAEPVDRSLEQDSSADLWYPRRGDVLAETPGKSRS